MEELALAFMMEEIKKQNEKNNMTDEKRLAAIKKDIIGELKKNGLDFKYFDFYVDLVLHSQQHLTRDAKHEWLRRERWWIWQ